MQEIDSLLERDPRIHDWVFKPEHGPDVCMMTALLRVHDNTISRQSIRETQGDP